MEKRISMHLILCLLMSFSIACKKSEPLINEDNKEIPAQPEQPVTPPTNPPVTPTEPDANATVYEFGRGTGSLVIDGNTFTLASKAIIKIKSGTYSTINIVNIKGTEENPVYVKNDGQVTINQGMTTDNITNVVISGDNSPNITYGFKFENISYRAIQFNGKMNGVTLKNLSFKNVNDYVISSKSNSGIPYTGSKDSRVEKFKILNCSFDNAGQISLGGNLSKESGQDDGLFKDVEIAYNEFKNTNVGSLCSFTNVQDYNIHHNTVNNVNPSNNNHNGIFSMQGNGTFHDNKLTNYQGNAIRMWLYSRGNTPVTVEIYNNICYNTRKYGAFELQMFERNIVPGKSTYANAKVYNNTAGQMNTSKDWHGQMLDLYNTGGTLEYYNNLGFDLYSSDSNRPVNSMINNMSDTKIIVESNNKYVSRDNAVNNLTDFSSKISGVGASIR
jgi:hypothetical protein